MTNNNTKKGPSQDTSRKSVPNSRTEKRPPVVDEEGFWSLDGKRKAHAMSPKSEKGVPTKNSFAALDLDSSPAKKKMGLDKDSASVAKNSEMLEKSHPTGAGASASSQSPKEMETDDCTETGIQGKSRIPSLDRKLSRDNTKPYQSHSQSRGKTGKPKFSL